MAQTKAAPKKKGDNPATKVILKGIRFSYAHLFTPTAVEGSDNKKYNVSLLIKKNHPQIKEIKKAIQAAIAGGHPKWKGKTPAKLKLPLRDGDEDRPDNPEYAGHYFLGANSNIRPKVVDRDLNEIGPDDFKSGDYGMAAINFYTFSAAGNNGVACGLNNVRKMKDGEALAGGSTPEEDFGGIEDDDDESDDDMDL